MKLKKNHKDVIFDGVCSGIARYLDIDAIWIRLVFVFGSFIWLYIVLMLIMPEDK